MKKQIRWVAYLLLAAAGLFPCDGWGVESPYTVTNVSVRQRWPWSSKVDIDFLVQMPDGGDPARTVDLCVTGKDGTTPVALSWASLSGDLFSVAPGYRHIEWDPEVDQQGTPFTQFNVAFTTQLSKATYMIVDLNKTVGETDQITYRYDAVWQDVTNSIYKTSSLVFRRIPATTSLVWQAMSDGKDYFTSGSPASEVERDPARENLVNIKLRQDYWLAVFELTQAQLWCITNGFTHTNDEYPVNLPYDTMRGTVAQGINWPTTGTNVAPYSVLAVFRKKTGLTLDLSTEAQWEYACRAGTTTPFHDGVYKEAYTTNDYNASLMTLGRFKLNGNSLTWVGRYLPNAWGVYDMHGNSYESCLDWKVDNINPLGLDFLLDPTGPTPSPTYTTRIVRGGVFSGFSKDCRSALRTHAGPSSSFGYRLVVPAAD